MYTTEKGGLIPSEVALHHKSIGNKIIDQSLKDAKVKIKDIDLISFSNSPGLAPCLLSTMHIAKDLAKKYKKPLIGVNHIAGHLTLGQLLTKSKDPVFILATGANTQIVFYKDGRYNVGGETLDIGLGNALDKFGREINLGFPAGQKIEQLAKKGKYIELPYTVKGMDLAFSGIITSALNHYKKNIKIEDLCFSLQETFFSMLTEVTERALAFTEKNSALLIGGVAANLRLVEMLTKMCKDRNCNFSYVPLKYSGDNGTQIAWQGILEYLNGRKQKIDEIDISPRLRIDQVNVNWIK